MPTGGAGLGGVAGIDRDDRDASAEGLVLDEQPELRKGPEVVQSALRLPNRCPGSDSLEVFQGNPLPGAFGCLYDLFADVVVDPLLKTSLFTSGATENPSCIFARRRLSLVGL